MKEQMFYKDLILLDVDVRNSDEFFETMDSILLDKGFVNDGFLEAIKYREAKYPTALPTEPYSIAIPHTDPEYIEKPFIAVARLKDSAEWKLMASEDEGRVKVVFLLGFKHNDYHVQLLQNLMDLFMKDGFRDELLKVESKEDCLHLVESKIAI